MTVYVNTQPQANQSNHNIHKINIAEPIVNLQLKISNPGHGTKNSVATLKPQVYKNLYGPRVVFNYMGQSPKMCPGNLLELAYRVILLKPGISKPRKPKYILMKNSKNY